LLLTGKFDQKIKKVFWFQKYRDKQLITCYSCNSCVKITIYEDFTLFEIEINHLLHLTKPSISISSEIKQFIWNNIDLLPHKIYKWLTKHDLNINIWQKQIHYWWTELGKVDIYEIKILFIKWLKKKLYNIIFQKENPKAFGFLTKFWNILENFQFKVSEIGVDATCKYISIMFRKHI
jgi:hypothetical protein